MSAPPVRPRLAAKAATTGFLRSVAVGLSSSESQPSSASESIKIFVCVLTTRVRTGGREGGREATSLDGVKKWEGGGGGGDVASF